MLLLLLSLTCSSEKINKQEALASIITAHFNNMPILKEPMPIIPEKDWKVNQQQALPPPPLDTVIYNDKLFERLVTENVLKTSDVKAMKNQLGKNSSLQKITLPKTSSIPIVSKKELYHTNNNKHFRSHYQVSAPLFNDSETKVLITVNENIPSSSKGFYYVFEQKDSVWEKIYSHNFWIE